VISIAQKITKFLSGKNESQRTIIITDDCSYQIDLIDSVLMEELSPFPANTMLPVTYMLVVIFYSTM